MRDFGGGARATEFSQRAPVDGASPCRGDGLLVGGTATSRARLVDFSRSAPSICSAILFCWRYVLYGAGRQCDWHSVAAEEGSVQLRPSLAISILTSRAAAADWPPAVTQAVRAGCSVCPLRFAAMVSLLVWKEYDPWGLGLCHSASSDWGGGGGTSILFRIYEPLQTTANASSDGGVKSFRAEKRGTRFTATRTT